MGPLRSAVPALLAIVLAAACDDIPQGITASGKHVSHNDGEFVAARLLGTSGRCRELNAEPAVRRGDPGGGPGRTHPCGGSAV